ncbi:MAG: hypothetical protein ACPKPY_09730 [Nitrososphaeraceae archaeon]
MKYKKYHKNGQKVMSTVRKSFDRKSSSSSSMYIITITKILTDFRKERIRSEVINQKKKNAKIILFLQWITTTTINYYKQMNE